MIRKFLAYLTRTFTNFFQPDVDLFIREELKRHLEEEKLRQEQSK